MWLEQFFQDLRYAWRGLWRSRAFVATTVLTLAVGLGLVTVVFAVFNAYVLRPFAVRDPYSLHEIAWRSQDAAGGVFSWSEYQELAGRRDLFDAVIAERTRLVSSSGSSLMVGFVSGNYFETLGARVLLGRTLAEFDTTSPGDRQPVVLSHQAWGRLFGSNPEVLGREVTLNGHAAVIVGVMRPEFSGLDDSPRDVWAPLTMYPEVTGQDLFGTKQSRELGITLRLRHGVTAAQTQSALTPFMNRVLDKAGMVRAEVRLKATPQQFSFELLLMLSPIFAAFGLVLIAACTNVSNVMLARANARYRELGVRLSVGASRSRVMRQLLTEGLLISMLAALAGLAFAGVALSAGPALFVAALPPSAAAIIRVAPLHFDHRVFLFAFAAAAVATMLFALLPALQATRLTLTDALRGQPGGVLRGSALRNVLVTSQVTVSLVLLVGAATLIRNGASIGATDLGIDTNGVNSIRRRATGDALMPRAATALTSDVRFEKVAAASHRPLSEAMRKIAVTPEQGSGTIATPYTFVSNEYFSILRIPIVRGRGFLPEESRSEARVAIISAAAANAFWPGGDPIGKLLRIEQPGNQAVDNLPGYSAVIVIGVAKDIVSGLVFEGLDPSHIYLPASPTGSRATVLLVRGRVETLHTVLRKIHPDPFAFETLPLAELLDLQMFPLRMASWIGSFLSAVALALSLSGLYGVLTYTLSQRTREIGIRMALGATASSVVRLVMTQSVRLAGLGAVIGTLLAIGVMKALSVVVQMRNVSFLDTGSFALGLALVMAAAILAAFFPARRAARVNPFQTLRADG